MKRKILSFALVMMMVLPLLAVNVLAADNLHAAHFTADPKPITIYGSSSVNIKGETFDIYKLFDLESWDILTSGNGYDPANPLNNERFAYRINPLFEGFDGALTWSFAQSYFTAMPAELAAKGNALLLKELLEYLRRNSNPSNLYADIADPDVLEQNDDSWAVPLTKALIDYITATGISPDWQKTATSDPFVISDLPLGYYLIRSENYNPTSSNDDDTFTGTEAKDDRVTAIAALRTNEVAVEIHCKVDAPPIDKDVWYNKNNAPDDPAIPATPDWGGFTDVNIEDTVWFKLTSKVPNMRGYKTYQMVMYDLLSEGLSFNDDIHVFIAPPTANLTSQPLSYFVNYNSETGAAISWNAVAKDVTASLANVGAAAAAAYNVIVDFGDIKPWYNNQADGTLTNGITNYVGWDIVVIYSADLNDKAVITKGQTTGEFGNPNKVWLEYNNNPYDLTKRGVTRQKHVTVFTFELNVRKYFTSANGPVTDLVEGAVFNLYKADGFAWNYDNGTNKVQVTSGTPQNFVDLNGKANPKGGTYIEGQYMHTVKPIDGTGANGTTINLHTPIGATMNGLIDIIGLEAGEYYLVETDAPKGYNLLEAPIKVTITYTAGTTKLTPWRALTLIKKYKNEADYIYGDISGTIECTNPDDKIEIENKSGIKFPETGGIGTVIFYIIGGLLTVGTGFLLVVRSQMSKKRERTDRSKQPEKAAI